MKYAVSYRGNDYLHLTDDVYDLPTAIFLYQKMWEYDSVLRRIVYPSIFAESDTAVIESYDERIDDFVSVRVATDECFMDWDRYPPEGIWSKKFAEPRGIYKLPPDDALMSDDDRRVWIKKRLEELKIEY